MVETSGFSYNLQSTNYGNSSVHDLSHLVCPIWYSSCATSTPTFDEKMLTTCVIKTLFTPRDGPKAPAKAMSTHSIQCSDWSRGKVPYIFN